MQTPLKAPVYSIIAISLCSLVLYSLANVIVAASLGSSQLSSQPQVETTPEGKLQFKSEYASLSMELPPGWQVEPITSLTEFDSYGSVKESWVFLDTQQIPQLELLVIGEVNQQLTTELICSSLIYECRQTSFLDPNSIEFAVETELGAATVDIVPKNGSLLVFHWSNTISEQDRDGIKNTIVLP